MSTQTELEIVTPGAFASIQDEGRRGFRRIGVPWAGALDRRLMRIANALAGRPEDAPVIECFDGGLHVVAHGGAVKLAVAGDAVVEVDGPEGRRQLAPWRSVTIAAGEALRIRKMGSGRIAMVAVAGLELAPLIEAIQQVRRRGGAVLWFTEHRQLAADRGIPADRRHHVVGSQLHPLGGRP